MAKKYKIETNKKRKEKEYWIDRSGKIHMFKGDLSQEYASFHREIATQLYPESNKPTDILMNLGWIMVGGTVYSDPIIHKAPSQAQINKLDELDLYKHLTFLHNGYYISYKKYWFTLFHTGDHTE